VLPGSSAECRRDVWWGYRAVVAMWATTVWFRLRIGARGPVGRAAQGGGLGVLLGTP